MIKENATMIVSQYDIDRLQKALDKELAQRARMQNEPLETVIVKEGRSATICVPMQTFKRSENSQLMVTTDLMAFDMV